MQSYDPYQYDRNSYNRTTYYGETIGQYTAKTFLWMVLGLLVTFGVAIVGWITGVWYIAARGQWIILIATLAIAFVMGSRIERMQVGTAIALFMAYSILLGLTMSIYLVMFNFTSLILVFGATAVYFGILAAYGYLTKHDLSGTRPILMSGLLFLIVFGVISLFLPGMRLIDTIACLIGIAVFLGFTAFDTQKIRSYYIYYSGFPDMLSKASIFSALQLYLDFIDLFLYLLRFLGVSRSDNN